MTPGKFITLEGGEGAGKSTNLAFVSNFLQTSGKSVKVTREPGGTRLGESVRSLLLAHDNGKMSADTELLLIFAARAQHMDTVIWPSLQSGQWVICDRFTDASYAYQGGGRNIAEERIRILEQWVQGAFRPDLTLLFDVATEIGMSRAFQRSDPDRFESEQSAFFQRVRNSYLSLAHRFSDRIKIIDASQSLSDVQQDIQMHLEKFLQS